MLSGKFSSQQYKEHFFPAYPVFAYINANAPPQAKVLVAGEARNYYLKRPYQRFIGHGLLHFKKIPAAMPDQQVSLSPPCEKTASLSGGQLGELQRLQENYAILTLTEKETLRYFLRPLEPLFRHGSTCLYRLGDS